MRHMTVEQHLRILTDERIWEIEHVLSTLPKETGMTVKVLEAIVRSEAIERDRRVERAR